MNVVQEDKADTQDLDLTVTQDTEKTRIFIFLIF